MPNSPIPLARPGSDAAPGLAYATVTGRADKWFFLEGAAPVTIERALRADSCLIEPGCGDTVLVCNGGATAVSYILAVLVCAERDRSRLVLPGGVELHADHGKLQVDAQQIDLAAHQGVSLQAPKIDMTAIAGDLKFHRLEASAQEFQARLGVVTTIAQSVNSTVGRLIQKAKNSFRWIENLDETRAGRVRMKVDERFHLHAKHATMLADGQVKIDGEKIDLG
jgi:hypothetical protein